MVVKYRTLSQIDTLSLPPGADHKQPLIGQLLYHDSIKDLGDLEVHVVGKGDHSAL